MALSLLIPRLEWNFLSLTGNRTSGSAVLSGIADTTDVVDGMQITGTGIPAGTTVLSHTSSTITMSANATSGSATSTALTLWERFDFTYPPSKDSEENLKSNNKVTKSLSGALQVQTNYIEATRDMTFDFLTHTQRDTLQTNFFLNWAALGNDFNFYLDQADSGYETYNLNKFEFDDTRQVKKHPYFLYQLKMSMRRVVL